MTWHDDEHQGSHRRQHDQRGMLVVALVALVVAWVVPMPWPARFVVLVAGLVPAIGAHLVSRGDDR